VSVNFVLCFFFSLQNLIKLFTYSELHQPIIFTYLTIKKLKLKQTNFELNCQQQQNAKSSIRETTKDYLHLWWMNDIIRNWKFLQSCKKIYNFAFINLLINLLIERQQNIFYGKQLINAITVLTNLILKYTNWIIKWNKNWSKFQNKGTPLLQWILMWINLFLYLQIIFRAAY